MLLDLPVYTGVFIAFCVGVIVLSVSFGMTLVRHRLLKVSAVVEDNDGWHQLAVTYLPQLTTLIDFDSNFWHTGTFTDRCRSTGTYNSNRFR